MSTLRDSLAAYPFQATAAAVGAFAYVIATAKAVAWTALLIDREPTTPRWVGRLRVVLAGGLSTAALAAVLAIAKSREAAWSEVSPWLAPALGVLSIASLIVSGRAGAQATVAQATLNDIALETYMPPETAWLQGMDRVTEQLNKLAEWRLELVTAIRTINDEIAAIDRVDDAAFKIVRSKARAENAEIASVINHLEHSTTETLGIYDELVEARKATETGKPKRRRSLFGVSLTTVALALGSCSPPPGPPTPPSTAVFYEPNESSFAASAAVEAIGTYTPGEQVSLISAGGDGWSAAVPTFEFNADAKYAEFTAVLERSIRAATPMEDASLVDQDPTRVWYSPSVAASFGLAPGEVTLQQSPDWAVVVDTSSSMHVDRNVQAELQQIEAAWIRVAAAAGGAGRLRVYEASPTAVLHASAEHALGGGTAGLQQLYTLATDDVALVPTFNGDGSSDIGVTLERIGQSASPPRRLIILTDGRLVDSTGRFSFYDGLPDPAIWETHLSEVRRGTGLRGVTIDWCGVDRRSGSAGQAVDPHEFQERVRHITEYSEAIGAVDVRVLDACDHTDGGH